MERFDALHEVQGRDEGGDSGRHADHVSVVRNELEQLGPARTQGIPKLRKTRRAELDEKDVAVRGEGQRARDGRHRAARFHRPRDETELDP